jgi:hypothetical protein
MDWLTANHRPGARVAPPVPAHVTTLFRLIGGSKRPIRCATYLVATGIELRIGYEDDEDAPLRTQLFREPNPEVAISAIASAWRGAFDGRGFNELAVERQPEEAQ